MELVRICTVLWFCIITNLYLCITFGRTEYSYSSTLNIFALSLPSDDLIRRLRFGYRMYAERLESCFFSGFTISCASHSLCG